MKIGLVMPFYKECVNSYRYQSLDRSDYLQTIYIRKNAVKEKKPPSSIFITINGLED